MDLEQYIKEAILALSRCGDLGTFKRKLQLELKDHGYYDPDLLLEDIREMAYHEDLESLLDLLNHCIHLPNHASYLLKNVPKSYTYRPVLELCIQNNQIPLFSALIKVEGDYLRWIVPAITIFLNCSISFDTFGHEFPTVVIAYHRNKVNSNITIRCKDNIGLVNVTTNSEDTHYTQGVIRMSTGQFRKIKRSGSENEELTPAHKHVISMVERYLDAVNEQPKSKEKNPLQTT